MIALRKAHPAFRMGDADMVCKHLEFLPVTQSCVIVFRLKDHANGDAWEDIIVALNSNKKTVDMAVPAGYYVIVCKGGKIDLNGMEQVTGDKISVPTQSALVV